VRALLISDRRVTEAFSTLRPYIASARGWLAGDWPSTEGGGVLNITAAAWTAGLNQWWRSGDITQMQNVSEYMLVLALCLVVVVFIMVALWNTADHYIFALSFVYGRPI